MAELQSTIVYGDLTVSRHLKQLSLEGDGSLITDPRLTTFDTTQPSTPVEGQLWYDTTNNVLKSYNGSSWDNVVGYTGSQGPIGYTGSRGQTGYTGSRGQTGYTGSKGDIGYTGSQSTVQGPIGYTGSRGQTGYTGSRGDIGYTGSQSTVQGPIGYTGSRGYTGTSPVLSVNGYTGSVYISDVDNADKVDGYHASYEIVGSTVPVRSNNGYLFANLFSFPEAPIETTIPTTAEFLFRYNSGNAYIHALDPSYFMDWLNTKGVAMSSAVMSLAGGTFSGTVNFADNIAQRPEIKDYAETVYAHGTTGGAKTIDLTNGNIQTITLNAATTFTFSNPPATGKAGSLTLIINQGTTAYSVTWPSSVDWSGGSAPDLSTVSTDYVLTFITLDAGTTWRGWLSGSAFA